MAKMNMNEIYEKNSNVGHLHVPYLEHSWCLEFIMKQIVWPNAELKDLDGGFVVFSPQAKQFRFE
jgi:hypothetical protein